MKQQPDEALAALKHNHDTIGMGTIERKDIACETCGVMRYGVKVRTRTRNGVSAETSYEKQCKACNHDKRARHYDRVAAEHRQKANAERARQAASAARRRTAARAR